MKLGKNILYTILTLLLMATYSNAETYQWYFSDDNTGNPAGHDTNNNGTKDSPWKSLSKARSMLFTLSSSDVATLYFDRGDSWTYDWGINGVLSIRAGKVTITSYGSGNKPVFDGEINFSNPPEKIIDPTPYRYYSFIDINAKNATIKNLEIKNGYGKGVVIRQDGATVQENLIHNMGATMIDVAGTATTRNATIQKNELHTGQQLNLYKIYTGWGPAIGMVRRVSTGSIIRYNKIYDIYGEGIIAGDCTVEYNLISDTYSAALYAAPHGQAGGDLVVRYNIVIGTKDETYTTLKAQHPANPANRPWSSLAGVCITDERTGGNNENCHVQVYGNIVIGCYRGIKIYNELDDSDPIPLVDIYNNTLIDNLYNIEIGMAQGIKRFDLINIFNNSLIKYNTYLYGKQTFVQAGLLPSPKVSIEGNRFWTEGETPSPHFKNTINFNSKEILYDDIPMKIKNIITDWSKMNDFTSVHFNYSTNEWNIGAGLPESEFLKPPKNINIFASL